MKALKSLYALLILSLLTPTCFTACNNTDDGSYVSPITLGEKIQGEWMLKSVTQVDEISGESILLTDQFDFASFTINLKTDDENNPTTFNVEGSAPTIIPVTGSWDMGYPYTNADGTASKIILYSDESHSNKVTELTVTSVPGANKVLEFKLTRKTKGQAFVSYVYNLESITAE